MILEDRVVTKLDVYDKLIESGELVEAEPFRVACRSLNHYASESSVRFAPEIEARLRQHDR